MSDKDLMLYLISAVINQRVDAALEDGYRIFSEWQSQDCLDNYSSECDEHER